MNIWIIPQVTPYWIAAYFKYVPIRFRIAKCSRADGFRNKLPPLPSCYCFVGYRPISDTQSINRK